MPVKEKKRGRPSRSESQLTAELIVFSARTLMQDNGKVPSIRQVSGDLGVDAMAIYHYFSSKSALLEAVTASLVEGIYEPKAGGKWQEELEQLCKSYLELLGSCPGLLETLLSMKTFGPAQLFNQRLAVALASLQLTQTAFEQAQHLLVDYMHGAALAIQCNPSVLLVDCIDGPLNLICSALESRQ
ncbi:MAG: TetR family transcriptional regulator [Amphritea sp.]